MRGYSLRNKHEELVQGRSGVEFGWVRQMCTTLNTSGAVNKLTKIKGVALVPSSAEEDKRLTINIKDLALQNIADKKDNVSKKDEKKGRQWRSGNMQLTTRRSLLEQTLIHVPAQGVTTLYRFGCNKLPGNYETRYHVTLSQARQLHEITSGKNSSRCNDVNAGLKEFHSPLGIFCETRQTEATRRTNGRASLVVSGVPLDEGRITIRIGSYLFCRLRQRASGRQGTYTSVCWVIALPRSARTIPVPDAMNFSSIRQAEGITSAF
ncbi:hypothetical protein CBL_03192 [Carabus blaptoides fortunei]